MQVTIYDEKVHQVASREAACKPLLRNRIFKFPQINPLKSQKTFSVGCHAIDFKLPALSRYIDTMKVEAREGGVVLLLGHPPSSGEEWTMHAPTSSSSSFSSSSSSLSSSSSSLSSSQKLLKELDRLSSQPSFNQSTLDFLSSILFRPISSSFLPPLLKCGNYQNPSSPNYSPYSHRHNPPPEHSAQVWSSGENKGVDRKRTRDNKTKRVNYRNKSYYREFEEDKGGYREYYNSLGNASKYNFYTIAIHILILMLFQKCIGKW